ncbi:hypothetical protein MTR67_051438, partial [Solanum verrucosum]
HGDQVFDESSHQIDDSVHEFDMAFDLVEGSSMGLQMPLQVTQAISTPTWCAEIDYRGDTHFRKSNVVTDECLETITDIVFGGSLQRMCESMTDGLSTCYWFDTVSQPLPPFSAGMAQKQLVYELLTIGCSTCWRVTSKLWDQAIQRCTKCSMQYPMKLARYMYSGSSINALLIPLAVPISYGEPPCFRRVPLLLSWLSRQKIDLEVSDSMYVDIFDSMYVDIIFLKPTIIEDLYLYKLSFENKGDVSKSEIQSYDVRNDVKHEKFNEGIRHAECFFPVDAGANLFMVKLGGTVKVNCVWDPGISSKTMHQNGLMKTTEAHLLLEFTSLLFNYFYDAHVKENTQVVHKITMSLKKLLDAWSDKYLTVEVTMQHQNVSTDQCAYWCLNNLIYISPDKISF